MFASLARRLTDLTRPVRELADDDRTDEAQARETGWHESSWVMARGVEVIELPAAAAAELFPDTQPAFHATDEAARRAA